MKQVKGLADPSIPTPAPPWRTQIIGHRGSPRKAAENTLCSAQLAIDEGANGVEVDVCVTSDGHIVLWHDFDPDDWVSVARQTGLEACAYTPFAPEIGSPSRKRISQLSLDEFVATHGYKLADADAAGELGVPCPETLNAEPLEPTITWLAGDARVRELILDIKLSANEAHLGPVLLDDIERYQQSLPRLAARRVRLLTPQREVYTTLRHELARRTFSNLILSADFERTGVAQTARELGARHVSIGITTRFLWPSVREEVVEALALRASGELESVTVWTSNREEELAELISAGVDSVLTDDIPLALKLRDTALEGALPQVAANA